MKAPDTLGALHKGWEDVLRIGETGVVEGDPGVLLTTLNKTQL
ncbi:MAG TPA: hypothetical protein VIM67_07995 [Terriglobus sp.]